MKRGPARSQISANSNAAPPLHRGPEIGSAVDRDPHQASAEDGGARSRVETLFAKCRRILVTTLGSRMKARSSSWPHTCRSTDRLGCERRSGLRRSPPRRTRDHGLALAASIDPADHLGPGSSQPSTLGCAGQDGRRTLLLLRLRFLGSATGPSNARVFAGVTHRVQLGLLGLRAQTRGASTAERGSPSHRRWPEEIQTDPAPCGGREPNPQHPRTSSRG